MDFVYVDDIARANVLALASDASDEVFNIASGVETTLNELAATLAAVMGVHREPEYGPERAVNAVPRRLASTRKADAQLGFRADGAARRRDCGGSSPGGATASGARVTTWTSIPVARP